MRAVVLGIVLAAGLAAGGVAAQAPAGTDAVCTTDEIEAGGYCWHAPAHLPLLACVASVVDGLNGREAVTVQAIVRQPDGVRALPVFEAAPVGAFAQAEVGSCYALAAEPVTE